MDKSAAYPDVAELIARLEHAFERPELLEQALTHASYGRRGKRSNNERLEFLGDRVLGLIIAGWLYEKFPSAAEGDLARRHATLVSRDVLARIARDLTLGGHIRLAQNDTGQAERSNATILADTLEAVIAALYLDGGLAAAGHFIRKHWQARLDTLNEPPQDPKTALQEWAQGQGFPVPAYSIVGKSGPPHAPLFEVAVTVPGFDSARATGSARQKAEKAAATLLMQQILKKPKASPAQSQDQAQSPKKPRKTSS